MNDNVKPLYYIFRIACAMCFIGHGAFGFITKQIWCNYFAVVGIGESLAYRLMPVVGAVDIALGLVLLAYPLRIAAAWLIFWGMLTALMRPLSGEPFAEFLERAGNYGAPFILLLLSGGSPYKWFEKLNPQEVFTRQQWRLVMVSLQVVGFTLLFGHGWLNIIEKQSLLKQYESLGFGSPGTVAQYIGTFEIIGAFSLLLWPVRQIVLVLFIWKVLSETQYPAFPVFEWVERGGSYATLLALWILLKDGTYSARPFFLKPRTDPQGETLGSGITTRLTN